jgi:hypothetical protein
MAKVQVVVKATGKKQWVPAHFVGHPVLGKGIELPPSVRKAKTATPTTPTTDPDANQAAEETPATGDTKE